VQYLVLSAGLSDDVVKRASGYLQGALVSTYFVQGVTALQSNFESAFASAYGQPPTVMSAFGYDAATLISHALLAGSKNRVHIWQWLALSGQATLNAVTLTTPFDGFTPEGEPKARPHLLQIVGTELIQMQ
jgi:ABC-type branched-subunit amino acid transport system substrate-binding protein